MATIHRTTMSPTKLALLAAWLPAQPWYRRTGRDPELARAGGFRIDDPQGEVGIEFMVVTDGSGDLATAYQIPMTYRASALDGAGDALIGTSEHGVLGLRWIYDGVHDPVLLPQLAALIQGDVQAQAQSVSDTPDPTVTSWPATEGRLIPAWPAVAANGPKGTDLRAGTASADGAQSGGITLRIHRLLRSGASVTGDDAGSPCLSATWRPPGGSRARGVFATVC
jgi:hypothetical protein